MLAMHVKAWHVNTVVLLCFSQVYLWGKRRFKHWTRKSLARQGICTSLLWLVCTASPIYTLVSTMALRKSVLFTKPITTWLWSNLSDYNDLNMWPQLYQTWYPQHVQIEIFRIIQVTSASFTYAIASTTLV